MLVDTQDLVTSAIEKYSGAEGLNMEVRFIILTELIYNLIKCLERG